MTIFRLLRAFPLLAVLVLASAPVRAGIGLEERLVLLGERIAANPADPSLYLRRALIYSDTGEFKLALADVDTAAQFGPVENTYFVRAILLYRLGQFTQALPFLDRFIAANPADSNALLYRARVLRDAGKREAALADYRGYFALHAEAEPGDYLSAARLIVELADAKRRGLRRSDALALLDARSAALGGAPQLERYAIEIEQQGCHAAAVQKRLERLPENARRAPRWHLQRAEQHLLLGERDAARAAADEAKTLLDERRPTSEKAELENHLKFLRSLLALPFDKSTTRQSVDAIYRRHYPAAVAEPSADATAAGSYNHAAVGGFETLRQAAAPGYEPAWAEVVQPFYRCLRDRKRARR